HELCHVYVGRTDEDPQPNAAEIEDWRWIAPDDLTAEMKANRKAFTPWFKLEWERLKERNLS
ncbi:MAG: NUDIX domain-containing protein, partial [Gammaproteobacteria bacterium]|nr:NUDIX domain-containing protein [Gammaproteobacteria bacterium]